MSQRNLAFLRLARNWPFKLWLCHLGKSNFASKVPEGVNWANVLKRDFFEANVWMIELDGSWSLGPKGPPQWSGQKSNSNFGTKFPHYRPPRPNQNLFSLTLWYQIIMGFEKQIWWRLVFHLFGNLLFDFLQGKWAKIEYLTNYWVVLPQFCWNYILYWNLRDSYKNDTIQVSGWWDMREWWWKIGFTPRAIRHFYRQH